MIKSLNNLIRRWRWVQAWQSTVKLAILEPHIHAEYVLRYNFSKFWWMKRIKDETTV